MQRWTFFRQFRATLYVLLFSITALLTFECNATEVIRDCFASEEECARSARIHFMFEDIKRLALVFETRPGLAEWKKSNFPDVLNPETLRKRITDQMVRSFSHFMDDQDKLPTVYVAKDIYDPSLEKKDTLSIYIELNINNYMKKDSSVGFIRVSMYRPGKTRFASIRSETRITQFPLDLLPEKLQDVVNGALLGIHPFSTGEARP